MEWWNARKVREPTETGADQDVHTARARPSILDLVIPSVAHAYDHVEVDEREAVVRDRRAGAEPGEAGASSRRRINDQADIAGERIFHPVDDPVDPRPS